MVFLVLLEKLRSDCTEGEKERPNGLTGGRQWSESVSATCLRICPIFLTILNQITVKSTDSFREGLKIKWRTITTCGLTGGRQCRNLECNLLLMHESRIIFCFHVQYSWQYWTRLRSVLFRRAGLLLLILSQLFSGSDSVPTKKSILSVGCP